MKFRVYWCSIVIEALWGNLGKVCQLVYYKQKISDTSDKSVSINIPENRGYMLTGQYDEHVFYDPQHIKSHPP
jgi:hypothetical protein